LRKKTRLGRRILGDIIGYLDAKKNIPRVIMVSRFGKVRKIPQFAKKVIDSIPYKSRDLDDMLFYGKYRMNRSKANSVDISFVE
jgi:hypothetical protein